jgi:uncharacterized protein with GYD domain
MWTVLRGVSMADESVGPPGEAGGKEAGMTLFMSQFAYTPEAWAALTRNPEDRSAAVRGLMESMGGRMVAFYHSFGRYDGVIISEFPDETTAASAILAAVSPGHVKAIETTTLLSVEDAMEAMRRAGGVTYGRPGQ